MQEGVRRDVRRLANIQAGGEWIIVLLSSYLCLENKSRISREAMIDTIRTLKLLQKDEKTYILD